MNFEILQDVGEISFPDSLGQTCGNTFAVNLLGDLIFLSNEGYIHFVNIRSDYQSGENRIKILPIKDMSPEELKTFTHIECSLQSDLLLLWSKNSIGVLHIPEEFLKNGSLNIDEKSDIQCQFVSNIITDSPIVKASFHPLNQHSIVYLLESDQLVLKHLPSEEEKKFKLSSPSNKFTSFTFGPEIEWLRFSIFLTSQNGNIYSLCPIIPEGAVLNGKEIRELWELAENENFNNELKENSEESIGKLVTKEYLKTYFGENSRFYEGDVENFVIANSKDISSSIWSLGENLFNSYLPENDSLSNYSAKLQGPLKVYKSNGPKAKSIAITDITALRNKKLESSPPILLAAYSNGSFDILLFDNQNSSSTFISPSWSSLADNRLGLVSQPSVLVTADSFTVPTHFEGKADWAIVTDPVYSYNFYGINKAGGEFFMMSSNWLKQVLLSLSSFLSQTDPSQIHELPLIDPSAISHESYCFPILEPQQMGMQISGVSITQDPFLGHVSLIQADNQMIAVNLSFHTKLCEFQNVLKQRETEDQKHPLKQEFEAATQLDQLRWMQTQSLLKQIVKGLMTFPVLEVQVTSLSEKPVSQNQTQAKKTLLETAQMLEKNVILPMKELGKNTLFHMDLIQQWIQVQQQLIQGHPSASSNQKENCRDLSIGIKQLLINLKCDHESLMEKFEVIKEKYDDLKNIIDQYTVLFSISRSKQLSPQEKVYLERLKDWSNLISKLNREVDHLKILLPKKNESFSSPSPTKVQINSPEPSQLSKMPFKVSVLNSSNKTPILLSNSQQKQSKPNFLENKKYLESLKNRIHKTQLSQSNEETTMKSFSSPSKLDISKASISTPQTNSSHDESKIQLSEEEVQDCQMKLREQTEFIQQSKKKLELLQKKLEKFKKLQK